MSTGTGSQDICHESPAGTAKLGFIQYVRPRGERRFITIAVSDELHALAMAAVRENYVFEAEVLTTGQVSLTIAGRHIDVAIEICNNTTAEVMQAVEDLIRKFDLEQARKAEAEAT